MNRDGGPADDVAWAQLLLSVLDEGRRTATYKLAVLLALIDCCVLSTDADGGPQSEISTKDLAKRVVELYWRQVRLYPHRNGPAGVLKQSSQPRAVTVDAVRELYEAATTAGARTVAAAEVAVPDVYDRTVFQVELNLVQMPLGKLQRPAGFTDRANQHYPRFLYEDQAFSERVTAQQLRARPMSVVLHPHVGDRLVSLAGLLRPLIELHWTREVARFNNQTFESDRLQEFLFGAERTQLVPVREALMESQSSRCFYCGEPLDSRAVQIDHFVPWSRIPNDGLTNLVASDNSCNNSKRDHFADLTLLHRWAVRPSRPLAEAADALRWPLRRQQSLSIARGLYAHLPLGTHMWQRRGVFTLLDRNRLAEVLPFLEET